MDKAALVALLDERIENMDYTDSTNYVAEYHFLPVIVKFVSDWLDKKDEEVYGDAVWLWKIEQHWQAEMS